MAARKRWRVEQIIAILKEAAQGLLPTCLLVFPFCVIEASLAQNVLRQLWRQVG